MRIVALFSIVLAAAASFAGSTVAEAQQRAEIRRPPRIVITPRNYIVEPPPTARRYCNASLVKQNRPSGPVIVPVMNCWWQ
jgi:hypothetical protein